MAFGQISDWDNVSNDGAKSFVNGMLASFESEMLAPKQPPKAADEQTAFSISENEIELASFLFSPFDPATHAENTYWNNGSNDSADSEDEQAAPRKGAGDPADDAEGARSPARSPSPTRRKRRAVSQPLKSAKRPRGRAPHVPTRVVARRDKNVRERQRRADMSQQFRALCELVADYSSPEKAHKIRLNQGRMSKSEVLSETMRLMQDLAKRMKELEAQNAELRAGP